MGLQHEVTRPKAVWSSCKPFRAELSEITATALSEEAVRAPEQGSYNIHTRQHQQDSHAGSTLAPQRHRTATATTQSIARLFRVTHACINESLSWSESASELYRLLAELVPTFADRGTRVISMTDSYGRILGSRPEPLLFLSSSSSVVLKRLSGPRSRPTASQEMW
jgi:hypothetical protein